MFRTKLLRRPSHGHAPLLPRISIPRRFRSQHASKDLAIAIAVDEVDWNVDIVQKLEDLPWHWARNDIASNDDFIDVLRRISCNTASSAGRFPCNVV